ncbi:hypothetical protein [Mycolicibacterium fortuitum]|uniref:Uncharacterized protein n=1 Tax=Mycolicibacterium fortuitum TaxID=1766 RepID=A0AAE4VGM2_MYCFO|nr:hypothetical protein [Mycolicibacterium fortuitum]MDV7195783.1 hypothetical protein [Mycolicibacterium fortuitum]MDV7207652.1 hypothetical protein [Mycolicibacterium fortuitum]MDV7229708.1 hypothetical protein [Mycolicibacterium fortuitum]MDV7261539.1 hypothetical protein [Mycolicibacterium fortuitum]MDV7286681.1 hypothetical protein [Mycolicibacterium fortuitum]
MSVEAVVEAEVVRSADEWAEVIKADLSRAVEGIVTAGQNLIAAKADVRHGEWLLMLSAIGISEAEASRLRAIATRVGNLPNLEALPRSVSALYELSRLPAEQIESGIESGAITPDMTIRDAKDFARPSAPEPEPTVGQCIQCGDTLPLEQLYEGGQGYECDPCVSGGGELADEMPTEPELPPLPENYMAVNAGDQFREDAQEEWEPERKAEPTSEPITPVSQPQKRKPLPDSFWRATYDLKKRSETVVRLSADDRFKKNKDQIADVNLSDLIRVRDALNGVIQQLEG